MRQGRGFPWWALIILIAIFWGGPQIISVKRVEIIKTLPAPVTLSAPLHLRAGDSFNVHCGSTTVGPLTVGRHTDEASDTLFMKGHSGVSYGEMDATYTHLIFSGVEDIAQIMLDTPQKGAIANGRNGCTLALVLQ